MAAVVPSAVYDFSRYQPGDVIVLRAADMLEKRTAEQMSELVGMITVECRKRSIPWTMVHDVAEDEYRITLGR